MTNAGRNKALEVLYRQNWAALYEIMSRFPLLSTPYLVHVHPDYDKADVRLVVVGKETNGWLSRDKVVGLAADQAVQELMRHYDSWSLGSKYSGKQSFWAPIHDLYQRLNPGGPTFGFVGLNASKMDHEQTQPSEEVRDHIIKTDLLREEIRILEPDVVVFHTGPRYEDWLDRWFPGLKRQGDMWFARLEGPGLPKHTFRSYHPQYLNRMKRRSEIYDRILREIR